MPRRNRPGLLLAFCSTLAACGPQVVAAEDGAASDSSRSLDDATMPDARVSTSDAAPDRLALDASASSDAAADGTGSIEPDASVLAEVAAGARPEEVVVRARSINGVAVRYLNGDDFFVLYAVADGIRSEVRLVRMNGFGLLSTTVLARAGSPRLAVSRSSLAAELDLRAGWYNGDGGIDAVALDAEGRVTARLPRSLATSAGLVGNRLALEVSMSDVVFEGTSAGTPVVRRSQFNLSGGSATSLRIGTVGDERQRALPLDVRSLAIGPGAYAYTRGDTSGTAFVQWLADWSSPSPRVLEVTGVSGPARVQAITAPWSGGELDLALASLGESVSQFHARFSTFSVGSPSALPANLVASNVARGHNEAAALTLSQSANGGQGVAYSSNGDTIQWRAFDPADGGPCVVTRLEGATWRGFSLAQRGARNKVFVAIATVVDRLGGTHDELHIWHLGDGEGLCGI